MKEHAWDMEGMKEMREQQLCDQRRQIEEKYWLEELEMETMKKKIEGQSNKDTEVAPVVQIVTEEEYIELFGTKSDDETFYGDLSETEKYRCDTRDTKCRRQQYRGSRIGHDKRRRGVTGEESD